MSLKTRITLWSVTTTVAVAIILIAVALIAERVTRQRVADAVLLGNTLIWEQLLADQLSRVKANKAEFDNEFDLRAAIKRGDRAAIQDYADRYVNLTGDSGSYDLLQILSLDQDPLYNSQPNLSLVRLSSLLNRVIADQKVHTGVLVTVDGTPMTVAAFPVASRGKLKGLALYAKRLDDVLTRLSARSGAGTALVGDKPYAVAALPEFDQLSRLLPGTGDRTVRTVSAGHRDYVFSAQPVADATGVPVAHLVVARDDTEALAQLRTFSRGAYLVVALTIIGGVLAMFFAVKRYLAPLQLAAATAGRVAKGDLTTRVPVTGVAEIAALEHAMDDMVLNLRDMMGSIGNISGQIRTSSDDLNHCVEQARTGVADQQVRSEAISHSLHEMSASVDEEARVTEQAAGAAVAMQTEAEQGHALLQQNLTGAQQLAAEMDDVSRTIEGLNTQAESVTDILAVIKGIAEQTNLLALNAAIEAARAGDQGRGFAVVADEVRALAGRTQHSTTEIADIIDRLVSGAADSVRRIHGARERVRDNANQADSALARFAGIREQVSELAGINQTIAAAVEEQSAVSKEIAANMRGIQQLGDANNQRSDYLFNTAQSLDELAGALASVTGHFRYESDDVPEAIVR